MSPLLIHTYPFDGASAGVRTMHYLAALLKAAGVPVAVTTPCFYNPTLPVRTQALPDDIVVYPDASRGNMIGGRRICRYMLYYASAYFGGDRIARDECAMVYHKDYLADVQAHCDHPVTEEDLVTLPTLEAMWCFPEPKTIENVLYLGKGDVTRMPKIPGPFTLISKKPAPSNESSLNDNMSAHQATLGLLRQAKNFYTLDKHTLMTSEAVLCGCKVFFPTDANTFEEHAANMEETLALVMNPERGVALARRFAERVCQFFGETFPTNAEAIAPTGEESSPARTARNCREQAGINFKEGRLAEARLWLNQILDINPGDFDALTDLGNLSLQLGDKPAAADALSRAAKLRPNDTALHVLLASTAYQAGRIEIFTGALTRALQLEPNNLPALQLLAKVNALQGRLADAAKTYFKILQQDEKNLDAAFGLGLCFLKQGNQDMARKSFERVLQLQPDHALARENLRLLGASVTLPIATPTPAVAKAKPAAAGKKFKVGVFTLDVFQSACGYLRWGAPLKHLQSQGRIEFLLLCEVVNDQIVLHKENIRQSDIIVVQRGMPVCLPYHLLRDAVKNTSAKIVFELDDALTQVPPTSSASAYFQSIRPQMEDYLRNADLVTVSTPRLKEIYSCFNDRIEVLPNILDAKLWQPVQREARQKEKVSILFSGTLTHQHDLALIEPAIERILKEFGDKVEFLFWGNLPASLRNRPQIRSVAEFTPDYQQYVGRLKTLSVDLALVPLEVTPFNRAKSDIKWLEYSACKIPAIFTDIDPYNQSVEHGKTGWLVANTVEAWHRAIKTLVLDEGLRRSLAENAHQTVLTGRSLEANSGLWLQAYEKTLAAPQKTISPQKPGTSIIIPTFNNLALTRRCLLALQKNAPLGQYEIIVVDNASTDGTVGFLQGEEKAGRLRVILNRENGGFARACNQGAQAAKADLLLFLNNDTETTPGWLDAMAAAARRPQTGIVGAKLLYANGSIQHAGIEFVGNVPDHPHRHVPADAPEVNQFRELDMVTGACLMIPRKLFLQLAGFDESYRNGVEDIDLCLRARAAGHKVVYEPKAVVFHLEGQSAGRFNHVNENLKIFFDRWGKSFDAKKRFITPKPARTIASQRSALLPANAAAGGKALNVSWEGTFLDFGSLSCVNRQLSKCLAAQGGVELSLVGDRTLSGSAAACPEMQELARTLQKAAAKDTQVTIRHQWPPDWRRPKRGALVVIQPWEFGSLPQDWVKAAANVDEFWLPSNYVRQVYIDSGVAPEKVFVVPNGVDAELFREGVKPMALPTRKKFRFLFVGGTIHRKGPDLLLQAYLNSFTAADDVCLVIKDFGGSTFYAGQTLGGQIKAAQARPDAPEILYLTEELAVGDMPGLYAACDCLAHPYRGEGFGIPVLEAMACGLPVIVTGGGATDDFAGDEHAYRIPAQRKNFGSEISGMKLANTGWLLEPDLNALAAQMKWVVNHTEEARRKGHAASEHARREWTWQRAAQTARVRLDALQSRKPAAAETRAPQPAAIPLPETARVGQLVEASDLLKRKNLQGAWESASAAIQARPFHPEACLLLGKVAQTAGDFGLARRCGQHAARLAPNWKPARQFLKALPGGVGKPSPFLLPAALPDKAGAAPRLTVCLIVKNEEKFLGQCLQSVRDIARQIVVVDTGSTDRTIEIAKEFNAEVHTFTWNDDFSAARNEALKYATGDWVLSIDADEEFMAEHKQILLEELQSSAVMGYRIPLFDELGMEEGCCYVPRLFRNAPGLFYVGRVHEQVFSTVESRGKEWGLELGLGHAALLHHGYTKELVASRGKIERNLGLLRRAVEEMPGEPNLIMNLGLETIRSGQLEEGLEKYREALRIIAAWPPGQIMPEVCETLLTQLTDHLLVAGRFSEIVELWRQPFPQSRERTASQHFMLGVAHLRLNQPAAVVEQMRQCLAKRGQPALSPINIHILKAGPRHFLALSLAALGQKAEAQKTFHEALGEDPKSRPVRFDFAKFHFQNGRPLDALKLANELVAENPKDAQTWLMGGHVALSQPQFLEFAQNWTREAVKNFPEDPAILLQRAEALTLNQDLESALPLWLQAHTPDSARHLAALTLCEALAGDCRRNFAPPTEKLVSQEFLKWYRQLIRFKAVLTVNQINEKLDEISAILPSAAGVLGAAMKQAEAALAV